MAELTKQEISRIANGIGLPYAVFAAFIEVESGGKAFDEKTGKIIIQFEPHIFARYLTQFKVKFSISSTVVGKRKIYTINAKGLTIRNGVEGQRAENNAYDIAMQIHPEAAMLSTSFGMGQIMGFNYAALGYDSVKEMVKAFNESEFEQVRGIASFILSSTSLKFALLKKDWRTAARIYNGPNYAAGRYHIKLENAHTKYSSL